MGIPTLTPWIHRYLQLLGQPGSNPLDLFKFYIEDLKARLHDEKRVVKEILRDRGTQVETATSFEEFYNELSKDPRALSLDQGNIKLTFQSLVVKAEARDRERQRNEERKNKRKEASFRQMLEGYLSSLSGSSTWEEMREELSKEVEFEKVAEEAQRKRLFMEYIRELREAEATAAKELEKKTKHKSKHSSHKHGKKHKRRTEDTGNNSGSEGEEIVVKQSKKVKRRISNSADSESEGETKRKKHKHDKKKSKKKRAHHLESNSEAETKPVSKRKHGDTQGAGGSKSGEGKSKHKHRHHDKEQGSPMDTDMARKNSRSGEDRKESTDSEGQI